MSQARRYLHDAYDPWVWDSDEFVVVRPVGAAADLMHEQGGVCWVEGCDDDITRHNVAYLADRVSGVRRLVCPVHFHQLRPCDLTRRPCMVSRSTAESSIRRRRPTRQTPTSRPSTGEARQVATQVPPRPSRLSVVCCRFCGHPQNLHGGAKMGRCHAGGSHRCSCPEWDHEDRPASWRTPPVVGDTSRSGWA